MSEAGLEAVRDTINKAKRASGKEWPQPKDLPSELAKVEAFDSSFLPERLAPWVNDISDRLQCPPDYVGVAAITGLGAAAVVKATSACVAVATISVAVAELAPND